mgnify:CR=1 FL=1
MTIEKSLYVAPSGKKNILLASKTGAEEAEMELNSLLEEFQDWRKDNEGSFKDFLKYHKDPKVIKLKNGGTVNEKFINIPTYLA